MYEISKRDNIEWWKENKNYEKALRDRLGYIDGTVHSVTETFDSGQSKKIARTLRVARKDAKAENMAARKARKEARKARKQERAKLAAAWRETKAKDKSKEEADGQVPDPVPEVSKTV
jgi:Tfp pilus assembly protein FimV